MDAAAAVEANNSNDKNNENGNGIIERRERQNRSIPDCYEQKENPRVKLIVRVRKTVTTSRHFIGFY